MRCSIKGKEANGCMIGDSSNHGGFSSCGSSCPRDKPVRGHKDAVARSQDNINKLKIADKGCVFDGKISGEASNPIGRQGCLNVLRHNSKSDFTVNRKYTCPGSKCFPETDISCPTMIFREHPEF